MVAQAREKISPAVETGSMGLGLKFSPISLAKGDYEVTLVITNEQVRREGFALARRRLDGGLRITSPLPYDFRLTCHVPAVWRVS